MRKGLIRISVLWVTLPLLLPMAASTQGTPEQAKDTKHSASSAVKQGGSNATAEKKPSQAPVELGLKPVSTADAALSAAQAPTKRKKGAGHEARTDQPAAGKSAVDTTDDSPVAEVRPAPKSNPAADDVMAK